MSHRLKFAVAAICGLAVVASSLAWMQASSRLRSGSDAHQGLACASGARAAGDCRASTPAVIHLGTIVVTPTPGEERYAFSLASRHDARNASPLAREGNVSG